MPTRSTSKPDRWTALQCALDNRPADEEELTKLCTMLIANMSGPALAHQTGSTGQTFVHAVAARGRYELTKALLDALSEQVADAEVARIINLQDHQGRGAVDQALKSSVKPTSVPIAKIP